MAFDVVTYILSKKYTDAVISKLPQGFIYKGSVSYFKDLPTTATIGHVYTVVYKGESGTEIWGAEFVCDKVESGTPHWIQLGADYEEAITKLEERIAATYLPLTAGSTKSLKDELYINTTAAAANQINLSYNSTDSISAGIRANNAALILGSNNGNIILRTNTLDKSKNTKCSMRLDNNGAQVIPEVNNVTNLGAENYQWKNIYGTTIYQNSAKVAVETDITTEATARESADIALQNNIDTKQDILVSGTNIKTVNNNSLLGAGNIDVTALIGQDFVTKNTVGGISAGTSISATETLANLLYRILGTAAPVHEYKCYYFEGIERPTTISSAWTTTTVTEEVKTTGLTYNIVGGIQGYLGIAFNKALGVAKSITQNDFTLNFLDDPSDFDCTEVTYDGENYLMYVAKEIAILSNGDKYKVHWN